MTKLIACYIVLNEENMFFKGSIESVIDHVDGVLIIDGWSRDKTLDIIDSFSSDKIKVVSNKYLSGLRGANGIQRNEYLKYAARIWGYEDVWVLVLDADEIVSDDVFLLRGAIENGKNECYDIRMVHFIRDFGHVDATRAGGPEADPDYVHYVPRRLFKLTPNIYYEEAEHVVPQNIKGEVGRIDSPCIYHCGYLKSIEEIVRKLDNHRRKSNIHSPDFLTWWGVAHLTGTYPTKPINLQDIKSEIIKSWIG